MNTLAALLSILFLAMTMIIWLLVIQAILSWLVAFNVVSMRQPFVRQLVWGLGRLTEPLLGPIRRVLPPMGGLDLSPMALIFGLIALRDYLLPALLRDAGIMA
jgi:YggT family protein